MHNTSNMPACVTTCACMCQHASTTCLQGCRSLYPKNPTSWLLIQKPDVTGIAARSTILLFHARGPEISAIKHM